MNQGTPPASLFFRLLLLRRRLLWRPPRTEQLVLLLGGRSLPRTHGVLHRCLRLKRRAARQLSQQRLLQSRRRRRAHDQPAGTEGSDLADAPGGGGASVLDVSHRHLAKREQQVRPAGQVCRCSHYSVRHSARGAIHGISQDARLRIATNARAAATNHASQSAV